MVIGGLGCSTDSRLLSVISVIYGLFPITLLLVRLPTGDSKILIGINKGLGCVCRGV